MRSKDSSEGKERACSAMSWSSNSEVGFKESKKHVCSKQVWLGNLH